MELLLAAATVVALIFGALYAIAKFVKICLEIHASWPRREPPPSKPQS